MKTAILLLAIAVTLALIKLVMLSLQIRSLERRLDRMRRQIVGLKRKTTEQGKTKADFWQQQVD